jgi:hypothetical protein
MHVMMMGVTSEASVDSTVGIGCVENINHFAEIRCEIFAHSSFSSVTNFVLFFCS